MLKSTQTNKYETLCFVQEAPQSSELKPNGYTVRKSAEGHPFVEFTSTMQSFGHANRMGRRYSEQNVTDVINNDNRIQDLKKRNIWRGEWNHPNPDLKNTELTSIRMTIPSPQNTSHFINKDHLEGDKLKATIITHPQTSAGRSAASEIIDLHAVPAFSVRLLGMMIPNVPPTQPNMKVTTVITFDMVDYPSHADAIADIPYSVMESCTNVIFLKELAKYCTEQDENMKVVCESFQMSKNDILGINNAGNIIMESADHAIIHVPLQGDVRREALSILTKKNSGVM